MVLWKWEKYELKSTTEKRYTERVLGTNVRPPALDYPKGYSGYRVDREKGYYIGTGSTRTIRPGSTGYVIDGGKSRTLSYIRDINDSEYNPGSPYAKQVSVSKELVLDTYTRYEKGRYIETVIDEENTYPLDNKKGNYWYVSIGEANRPPIISGSDQDLGSKTTDFEISYIATDEDGDTIKITVKMDDLIVSGPSEVTNGMQYHYPVVINDVSMGHHTITITADDGKGGTDTRRFFFERVNSAPRISGEDKDLGAKNTAFSITVQVSDENPTDKLTLTAHLNNVEIRRWQNAPRDEDIHITITDEMIQDLELNQTNIIELKVMDDKGATAYRRYTFIRDNAPPIISGTSTSLGELVDPPTIQYSATDQDGDTFSLELLHDGEAMKSYEPAEPNHQYEFTMLKTVWLKTRPGQHNYIVNAVDNVGNAAIPIVYDYTRKVTRLEVKVKLSDTDLAAEKVNVIPVWKVASGAKPLVQVCNNVNDDDPTWEDATEVTLAERPIIMHNSTKTAENWGIGVRIVIERKAALQQSYVSGIGGSFA